MLDLLSSVLLDQTNLAKSYLQGMKAIEDIRRENFRALVKEKADGNQRKFSRIYDKNKDQVNGWLGKGTPRNIGSVTARELEHACGKPEGWMDQDHSILVSEKQSAYLSQPVGHERQIVEAAVKLVQHLQDMALEPFPVEQYSNLLFVAMQIVRDEGVDTVLDGSNILEVSKRFAARIRAGG